MDSNACNVSRRQPWNERKLLGQKAPLKLKEIWAIRVRLQLGERLRELAMFNLAIDSKLRSCDLVKLRFRDVCHGDRIATRAIVRLRTAPHISTRQYARVVRGWIREIGLDASAYGTHTMRRTKNLRVVQLLLGHSKLESTVRYLGIEVDDALEMAEQTEV